MLRMPYNKGKSLNIPITFPTPLSKTRDYNAIEILFYTIFYYFYYRSVESKNIHNPHRCNVELLPMLADYYRYSFTDVENIELEREIIETVPMLHHYKGCVIGIDNALELSKVDKTNEIRIPWFYDRESNIITVVLGKNVKVYKIRELLKLVVPLGVKIIIKPGYFVQASEEIKMHSWTEINCGPIDPEKQYYVQPNNFWHTTWDPVELKYHTYVDTQWAGGDPNNHDPHGLGRDGFTRVGGTEFQGNETMGPGGIPEESTDSFVNDSNNE